MSASENHNRLAVDFVTEVAAKTRSYGEMMVVMESAILAAMMILSRRHGFSPRASSAMIEAAVQAATERYVNARPSDEGVGK